MQSENISTPIYVECINQRFVFKNSQEFSYFVSGLHIQVEKSNSPVLQKIGCRWRNTTSHIPFFQAIDKNKWLSGQGW